MTTRKVLIGGSQKFRRHVLCTKTMTIEYPKYFTVLYFFWHRPVVSGLAWKWKKKLTDTSRLPKRKLQHRSLISLSKQHFTLLQLLPNTDVSRCYHYSLRTLSTTFTLQLKDRDIKIALSSAANPRNNLCIDATIGSTRRTDLLQC